MKQLLQKYADGIDAMALRERAMFFSAVALVLMALLQVFLLDPIVSRRNQLSVQIAQQDDETKAILAKIQTLIRPDAPDQDAINRDKLKTMRAQLEQIDQQFEQQQKQFVAPGKMGALLESMVGKNRKLKLMSLRNLPPASLSQAAGGAAPDAPKTPGTREVFRHAVELKISGGYFDLLDYLDALEHMPQQLFWDGFELRVAQYPQSVLTLTIYTLSPEKSWLTV
ncbi:MAG: MSHA biogenesis protein MshJ [Proteobacteria bacterium]|nr:MSHA biogenesis protein MshJ [Pseudomonadota bacterium]